MITEIAFILDRSGSMESLSQAAIAGFNEFLRDQQALPEAPRLTLVLFDHEILTLHDAVPVSEILPLNNDTYIPRGSTALLDAIGDTIDRLGARFAATPPAQQPGHVAVAIFTDGEENSSQRFNWSDIAQRIKHQTETYQWDFMFLGAGPDTIATAGRMNIVAERSVRFTQDTEGYAAATKSVSRKFSSSRNIKAGTATDADIADSNASLGNLVQEEDRIRREK